MPATYEPIATTTLGSAAATITFSSIPGTYTDLRLVYVGTNTVGGNYVGITLNGSTSSIYSYTRLLGSGSAASSFRQTSQTEFRFIAQFNGQSTTIPTMGITDIFSYAGSSNKTLLHENSNDQNGAGDVIRYAGLFQSTSAITSVTLTASAGNHAIGTTATLYGIKAA